MGSIYDKDFKKKVSESVEFMENSLNDYAKEAEAEERQAKRRKIICTALKVVASVISLAGTIIGTLAVLGLWPW